MVVAEWDDGRRVAKVVPIPVKQTTRTLRVDVPRWGKLFAASGSEPGCQARSHSPRAGARPLVGRSCRRLVADESDSVRASGGFIPSFPISNRNTLLAVIARYGFAARHHRRGRRAALPALIAPPLPSPPPRDPATPSRAATSSYGSAGKAVARTNALSHELRVASPVVPGEDPAV